MKKILMIAGGLQLGGAERVAANISKYAPSGYEFHYLVFEGLDNVYGAEIEARGGKVFVWPSPSADFAAYIRRLGALLDEQQYDAVHSHTMFNSGINLLVAKRHGVPCRIAHSHTTKTETPVSFVQRLYEKVMRCAIRRSATHLFSCGQEAGAWLFGKKCFRSRGLVIRNGIDTEDFRYSEENRAEIRRYYHIPENSFVIGHSGTLLPLKNQEFLIRLMPDILRRVPNAHLMLVGQGEAEMLASLRALVKELSLEERVTFCGGVMNVQDHLSAMDVFAFPSKREGTPLALLEAQANGLPCIVSACIPTDAFVTGLVSPLPLEDLTGWVNALCGAVRKNAASYAPQVAAKGYDARSACAPVYLAYRFAGETAHVCLSFDDGRGDNTEILDKILLPMHVPATLNVSTGYVDGSCPAALRPTDKPAMAKDDVIRLARRPLVEIALHGDRHQNTAEDILAGRDKLKAWLQLPDEHSFGFASPGSGFPVASFDTARAWLAQNRIFYLRTGLRITHLRLLRVLCRKVARVFHIPLLYRIAYADTLMADPCGGVLYSVPVMGDITLSQVKALVRYCVRKRRILVLMFHSILPDPAGDPWSWPQDRFRGLCGYLQTLRDSSKVKLSTTGDLFKGE